MSLKSKFAHEIFHARAKLGLTQQQVADAVSISVRWYQHIEKGTNLPGSIVMLRLFIFLDLDLHAFREEAEIIVPISSR